MIRTFPVAPVASGSTGEPVRPRRRPGPRATRQGSCSVLLHGSYHDAGEAPVDSIAVIGLARENALLADSVTECHPWSRGGWICAGTGSNHAPRGGLREPASAGCGPTSPTGRLSDSWFSESVLIDLENSLNIRASTSRPASLDTSGRIPGGDCWYVACNGSGRMGLGLSRPDHSRDRAPAHHREKMREAALRGSATGHAAQHGSRVSRPSSTVCSAMAFRGLSVLWLI